MKFGKRMADEMVPSWRHHYVSYKRLKQHVRQSPLRGRAFSDELFRIIREELSRAEQHFQVLLDDVSEGHKLLLSRKHSIVVDPRDSAHTSAGPGGANTRSSGKSSTTAADPASPTAVLIPEEPVRWRRLSTRRSADCAEAELEDDDEEEDDQEGGRGGGRDAGTRRSRRHHRTSGYPGLLEQDGDYRTPTHSPLVRNLWGKLKHLFFMSIGDKSRAESKRKGHPGKTEFIEWFTEARRLARFSELNIEAINKTLKKLRKWRAEEGDFTHSMEMEINMSSLTLLLPKLHGMVDDVKEVFSGMFEAELEQYENVTMATTEVWHAKWSYVAISVALFFAVLNMPVLNLHGPAHRCLALFVFVISMWVTEAIPFFCTAMLIPLIAVPLGVLQDPTTGTVAEPVAAARVILSRIFDHVQILVLGGLTMAKAMSKTHLEVAITAYLHSLTAHRPSLYLLGVMSFACVLCAFVSNVAAPLLVLSVIQQTLWEFPVEAPQAPRAILLGLAFACNVGGMLSPIASPQNAVAMQTVVLHKFSFASWIAVATPLVAIMLVLGWLGLLFLFQPFKNIKYIPHQVVANARKPLKKEVYLVSIVCLITVVLWCLPPKLVFGDTGIIALIPIVIFFGVGVLKKEDFNSLPWHLMFLLAGGNMLGQCARDSKLLEIVSGHLRRYLVLCTPYQILTLTTLGVGILTTFISHTVAAMVLMPVIASVGSYFPPHTPVDGQLLSWDITPEALVFVAVFMCSGAMAFPISSFPNVNSLLAEDEIGVPYLKARDFLLPGTVMTLICLILLITVMPPIVNFVVQYSAAVAAVAHTITG